MNSNLTILYIGSTADYFNQKEFENWTITVLENSVKATKYLQSTKK